MKVFLHLSFVGVRNLIFRLLPSLRYFNSAGINLNWARTNLREKEKKLSSQYDSNHLRTSQYFGRVIIIWKDIVFVRENKLKAYSNYLLRRDQRCYVYLFLCFSKMSRLIFTLDTFGRQAYEYITCGGMFLCFLCIYVCLYEPGNPRVFPGKIKTNLLGLLEVAGKKW